jgi:hypothetical protein
MNCTTCGGKTHVLKTFDDEDEVCRLRECLVCGARALTREVETPMRELSELYRYDRARRKEQKEQKEQKQA